VMFAMLLGNYMQLKLEHLFRKTLYKRSVNFPIKISAVITLV
jgi:hypothetical protein